MIKELKRWAIKIYAWIIDLCRVVLLLYSVGFVYATFADDIVTATYSFMGIIAFSVLLIFDTVMDIRNHTHDLLWLAGTDALKKGANNDRK